MKIKQIFGIVLLTGMIYGLWTKMSDGMATFRVEDTMLIFFIVLILGTLLFFGIRQVLRS